MHAKLYCTANYLNAVEVNSAPLSVTISLGTPILVNMFLIFTTLVPLEMVVLYKATSIVVPIGQVVLIRKVYVAPNSNKGNDPKHRIYKDETGC